jgi:CubicO group peptidase (beta-lactamase class C family)
MGKKIFIYLISIIFIFIVVMIIAINIISSPTLVSHNVINLNNNQKNIEKFFNDLAKKFHLSGTVLVARQGTIIFNKSYGLAEYKKSQPILSNTQFNIGSMAKQFTGFIILDLIKKGKLKLSDRLGTILPDLYSPINSVTIEQLLQMNIGIYDLPKIITYLGLQFSPHEWPSKVLLNEIRRYPLQKISSQTYVYNNLSYVLLALVVEEITKEDFMQVLKKQIFIPLDMSSTTYVKKQLTIGNLATGYLPIKQFLFFGDIILLPVPRWNYSFLRGASGIFSTVEDMDKWQMFLWQLELENPQLTKEYLSTDGARNYAYGWTSQYVTVADEKILIQWNSTEAAGFCGFVLRIPIINSHVIAIFNVDFFLFQTKVKDIIKEISKIILQSN